MKNFSIFTRCYPLFFILHSTFYIPMRYTFSMRTMPLFVGSLLLAGCTVQPHSDLIHITQPLPGATVGTTFELTGEARGTWYFEATFPVSVEDSAGRVMLETYVQAQGEWMTENFVPFRATVTVPAGAGMDAVLVIKNDNPSGLPENAKEVRIPISIRD